MTIQTNSTTLADTFPNRAVPDQDPNTLIFNEQIRQIERLAPLGLAGSVINALILAFLLRGQAEPKLLLFWLGAVLFVSLTRLPAVYRRLPVFRRKNNQKLAFFLLAGYSVSGFIWGSTALWLFPDQSFHLQVFLGFVLGGMTAGAAALLAVLLPAFLCFSVPTLLPYTLRLFVIGNETHLAMGAMMLLFFIILFSASVYINRTRKQNIRLAYENSNLVTHLRGSKERIEEYLRNLRMEVEERQRVEEELLQQKLTLEEEVKRRTDQLERSNRNLKQEISERRLAEERLVKSEEQFRHLVANVPGILFQFKLNTGDGSYRFPYMSDRVFEVLGLRAEAIQADADGIFALVPPEKKEDLWNTIAASARNLTGFYYETETILADGAVKWLRIESTPRMLTEAEILWEGVMVDITNQKNAESSLKNALTEADLLAGELERRGNDIRGKNRELRRAYHELATSHAQLLQQEKMASIGQLSAGIAHEINNPIGFVACNLGSLQKYLNRLATFIANQDRIIDASAEPEDKQAVARQKQELKIDYVLQDSRDLVKESLEGTDRVKSIVQDLKNFARADQSEWKEADINDCLESTINIVWNELKYKTELVKDYGRLPLTRCIGQQLNQVFMNLLVNAGQAIASKGTITVRTWYDKDAVHVSVADTGCGIAPDQINRIFEPFYTTKEAGQGTGLGLSIAYNIVKKHNGTIDVKSDPGKGSTITVSIPVVE